MFEVITAAIAYTTAIILLFITIARIKRGDL